MVMVDDTHVARPIPYVIRDHDGSVHEAATEFLFDRVFSNWIPKNGHRIGDNSATALSADIVLFLKYCRLQKSDWRNYQIGGELIPRSIRGWAYDMEIGETTASYRPLDGKTISRRVWHIQNFLEHAADNGYRKLYKRANAGGYKSRRTNREKRLIIPSKVAVTEWLERIRTSRSKEDYLMARLAFDVGLRKEEIVLLRTSCLPKIAQFGLNDFQQFQVTFGTKGRRRAGDDERKGKPRIVQVPTEFARELVGYSRSKGGRSARIRKILKAQPWLEDTVRNELFLSPRTGNPYSASHLNLVFADCTPPVSPWKPHLGRHTYACWLLVTLIRKHAEMASEVEAISHSKFGSFSQNSIQTVRAFLGHESTDTTDQYVQWAHDHMLSNREIL